MPKVWAGIVHKRKLRGMEIKPSPRQEFVPGSPSTESTIPEVFLRTATTYPENPCLIYLENHTFGFVPYKRLLNLVENLTVSLQKLGVKSGDRIAILSENRPEWAVSDLSVMSLRAMLAPIHTTLTAEQIKEIIYDTEPKVVIVSEKALLRKLIEIKKQMNKNIIILYYNIELQQELMEFGNERCHFIEALKLVPHGDHSLAYVTLAKKVKPNDTASIIFTVGPNGKYRGVELSHSNIISNAKGTVENVPIWPTDKFLSVLPLSHAFEKMAGYYIPLIQGACIAYLTDIAKFTHLVKKHQPTVIIGVPRLYEKSFAKTVDYANKARFAKYLFPRAIEFGSKEENRTRTTYKLYDQLVYKKIRDTFGGKLRFMISGGAALNPKVARFFDAVGIPILEGYGLTEFSPIVSVNKPGHNRIGTVGPPIANAQVKVAPDGEILIRGPSLMKGYYSGKNTPQLELEKGWFRTGDLGELDPEGFLKIIGRKKEVIVLSTGKNVSPRSIESQLTHSRYIRQAVVVGDDRKHIVALVVPNFARLQKKFGLRIKQAVMSCSEVKAFLQQEIDHQLHGFAKHEQVKKFALIGNVFSVSNHFLNDDKSLNRDKINAVYDSVVANLYNNKKDR
jgi:long-chain acyl-CoA synthetase